MDWRVTTVARSSLVTRCALTWSSADLASGASCSNFTSSTRSTVFSVVSTAARSLHPPRRVRGLRRLRAGLPGRGQWAGYTQHNADFFAELGSPGGASKVGTTHDDPPPVKNLPPQAEGD